MIYYHIKLKADPPNYQGLAVSHFDTDSDFLLFPLYKS